MDRIRLLREKEKEVKDMYEGLYLRDLKHYIEDREFSFKDLAKEIAEAIIFLIVFGSVFILLWILP